MPGRDRKRIKPQEGGGGPGILELIGAIQGASTPTTIDNPNFDASNPMSSPTMEGPPQGFWNSLIGGKEVPLAKRMEWEQKLAAQEANLANRRMEKEFGLRAGEAQAARNDARAAAEQERIDRVAADAIARGRVIDDRIEGRVYDAGQAIVNRLRAQADATRKFNDERLAANDTALRTARQPRLTFDESVRYLANEAGIPPNVAARIGGNFLDRGVSEMDKSETNYEMLKNGSFANLAKQPAIRQLGSSLLVSDPNSPIIKSFSESTAINPETKTIETRMRPGMSFGSIPIPSNIKNQVLSEEVVNPLFSRPVRQVQEPPQEAPPPSRTPIAKSQERSSPIVQAPLTKKPKSKSLSGDIEKGSPLDLLIRGKDSVVEGTSEAFGPALEMLDKYLRNLRPVRY